jgi:hypothetical protein
MNTCDQLTATIEWLISETMLFRLDIDVHDGWPRRFLMKTFNEKKQTKNYWIIVIESKSYWVIYRSRIYTIERTNIEKLILSNVDDKQATTMNMT